jgi:hypothetical protein
MDWFYLATYRSVLGRAVTHRLHKDELILEDSTQTGKVSRFRDVWPSAACRRRPGETRGLAPATVLCRPASRIGYAAHRGPGSASASGAADPGNESRGSNGFGPAYHRGKGVLSSDVSDRMEVDRGTVQMPI